MQKLKPPALAVLLSALPLLGACASGLTGMLTDARSGAPIADAWVWQLHRGDTGWPLKKPVTCEDFEITRTDADGHFALARVWSDEAFFAYAAGHSRDERLPNRVNIDGEAFFETTIVNRRYQELREEGAPGELARFRTFPLPPDPLSEAQRAREYPASAVARRPGATVFPLWKPDEPEASARLWPLFNEPGVTGCDRHFQLDTPIGERKRTLLKQLTETLKAAPKP